MPVLSTPRKTGRGWVLEMSPEMAREAGADAGSSVILYLGEGGISAEILPPATAASKRSVQESLDKFKDAFAELKRLGD